MKKFSFVLALVALLSVFGTTLPASAQAEVVKDEFTIINEFPTLINCDDSDYTIIRREINTKIIEVTDGKGRSHTNSHNKVILTVQDNSTGEIFEAKGSGKRVVNPNAGSLLVQLKLILPGPGNNYFTSLQGRYGENGVLILDSIKSTTECR